MNALATVIRLRRQELRFSPEDLAGNCQLDRPYISLIEVGRKQPSQFVRFGAMHITGRLTESQIALFTLTDDAREGQKAFQEKRKPVWQGQ